MIDKEALKSFVEERLQGSDHFLVELRVSADNDIVVEIDAPSGVDIDECVALSRSIEDAFPRDDEDYSLEVGSAGLTSPFKVKGQYLKNIGNNVEVLTKDGKKLKGKLTSASDDGFTIEIEEKVKKEGAKRPVIEARELSLGYDEIKYTKYLLDI